MKKKKIKSFSIMLMIMLLLNSTFPGIKALAEEISTVTISNKEDFIEFSKKCTLDTWSIGKTVNLNCDLDLSVNDFDLIPTFGGTFNGNGHTISGVNIQGNGSNIGLFRYVQENGKIVNLNVKGSINLSGTKSNIGGIVGENSGRIENCTFEGSIRGENVIGGISGKNMHTGQIISCTSKGNVDGENSTGGIVGENDGLILNCTNNAEVNTVYVEKDDSITDINTDAAAIVESYKINKEETEEESILGHRDTGGIVGYTSGVVQGCVNNADIGYQHVGYNIGGVAGRQSGYLLGCENNGLVKGRKDVGGIVGQAEPYITLNSSQDGLQNIKNELNNLNGMVNRLITDADNLGDDMGNYLDEILNNSEIAGDNAQILVNRGSDFIDDNIGEINAESAIISNTLDKLEPVFDNFESSTDNIAEALDDLSDILNNVDIPSLNIKDIIESLDNISEAEKSIKEAVKSAKKAVKDLKDAININSNDETDKAIENIEKAIKDIITAKIRIKEALKNIRDILDIFNNSGIIKVDIAKLIKNIIIIMDNIDLSIESFDAIVQNLIILSNNVDIDFSAIKAVAENIEDAIGHLTDAAISIISCLGDLPEIIQRVHDYLKDVVHEIEGTSDDLADVMKSLFYAADDLGDSIHDLKNIISDLANEDPLEFVKLGDDFKSASDNLFDSLSDISDNIRGLKTTLSNDGDKISGNLSAINNQFNLIMNLIIGEFEAKDNPMEDIIVDASDENIENTKQGKVQDCHNSGRVEADRNTGGIVGSMAIEYAKDPEDDIEKPTSLNFTYKTKDIIYKCINEGEIVGKKDCIGGVVGLSEMGTVFGCENYGNVESNDGKYIGGISGKNESAIRNCYSKGKFEGKRYIGGIAGKGENITNCYSIVNVSGEEFIGAICGAGDYKTDINKNFYVDNGVGAIDNISYSNVAEPIEFDALKNIENIPKQFISFTITFIADDKVVETQDIKYGEDTARIRYPKVPEKKGKFGTWEEIEEETVTENIKVECEYKPYVTVISSVEKNESGKMSIALCEGEFTDKVKLSIKESNVLPPPKVHGNVKVYDLLLIGSDLTPEDEIGIRLINENKDKVKAWIMKDDNWEEVAVKERGKYVIIQANGVYNTVCLQYSEKGVNPIIIVLGGVIIVAGIYIIRKKKNKIKLTKIS